MKEFGSDFHFINSYNSGRAHLDDVFRDAVFLADGRQCIVALIRQYGWKRIWMPDYFCYEVIETIRKHTNIKAMFYADSPFCEGKVDSLPFKDGDVLLRMNFFGMREHRTNSTIPCPVIEDHTHDLLGHWALFSDADWCISSIRKTLPVPEGGMMWSPKGHKLIVELTSSDENERIATVRWEGMEMKAAYLRGEGVSKDVFRKCYTDTEGWFDDADPCLIDERSKEFVSEKLDINLWQNAKRKNWELLQDLVSHVDSFVLKPEDESCTMFSFVLLLKSKVQRDSVRKHLIESHIYPAFLWALPDDVSKGANDFSKRMLSIHCDGRYTEEDIRKLAAILNEALEV